MGRYRIVARLGAGGMGRVYLGRSASGRAVAVKVVRPELADDVGFRRRFVREVEAARRVNGFFTATVVDANPDGSPAWLATAFVPGMSLEEAVRIHGAWPHRSVLALGAGLAEALEAIHGADVIHRDLKPSNVLLAADGPRVIDFGISVAAEASALTKTGMVVGTPGFMSPEQVTGKPVGPASDVFALGAVLHFAATGASPFGTGSAHAVNFRAVYEQPALAQIPPDLRDVVGNCLAKNPVHRPTVTTLLDQLVEAAGVRYDVTAVLSDVGWLPAPVATAVRTRSTEPQFPVLPSAPLTPLAAATALTEISDSSPTPLTQPEPRTDTPGGPTDSAVQTGLSRQPGGGAPKPGAGAGTVSGGDLPPQPPIKVSHVPGISRRRALQGLVGATTATGLGLAGWRIYTSSRLPEPRQRWRINLSEQLLTSPAVADGIVYISSTENTLYALDAATGAQKWKRTVTGPFDGSAGDLTAVGGNLYRSFGDEVYAHDAAGEEKWKFATAEDQWALPAAAGGVVYVSGKDNNVYALNAATGEEKWKSRYTAAGDESERASLAVAGGVVYTGTPDGHLVALDAATGEEKWKFATGEPGRVSPTVVDGVVYTGSSYGNMWALDAATGQEKWKLATNNGVATPAVAGGVVYASPYDLYALDAATGDEKWKWNAGDGYADSPPAVTGGVVCFGTSENSLYALDATTGKGRWKFETGDLGAQFAVANGVVYICDTDGVVYAMAT